MMGHIETAAANVANAVTRLAHAFERLSDAAMIAARAYEHTVKEDFDYDPVVEDED